MDDDLFSSFTAKPRPTGGGTGIGTSTSSSSGSKRAISPSAPQAPVDVESLKKLKTDTTTRKGETTLLVPSTTETRDDGDATSNNNLKREREQAFAVTDEMEITAQTKMKPSTGLQGGGGAAGEGGGGGDAPKEGEDEGLILSHQVSLLTLTLFRGGTYRE